MLRRPGAAGAAGPGLPERKSTNQGPKERWTKSVAPPGPQGIPRAFVVVLCVCVCFVCVCVLCVCVFWGGALTVRLSAMASVAPLVAYGPALESRSPAADERKKSVAICSPAVSCRGESTGAAVKAGSTAALQLRCHKGG